jgi:hypothetical protein
LWRSPTVSHGQQNLPFVHISIDASLGKEQSFSLYAFPSRRGLCEKVPDFRGKEHKVMKGSRLDLKIKKLGTGGEIWELLILHLDTHAGVCQPLRSCRC